MKSALRKDSTIFMYCTRLFYNTPEDEAPSKYWGGGAKWENANDQQIFLFLTMFLIAFDQFSNTWICCLQQL